MLIIPKSRGATWKIYLFNELHYRPIMMAHELQRSRGRSAPVNARPRLFTARWKINPFEWKYASVLRFIAADRWFRCLENHGQSGEFHSNGTPWCPITRSSTIFTPGMRRPSDGVAFAMSTFPPRTLHFRAPFSSFKIPFDHAQFVDRCSFVVTHLRTFASLVRAKI